MTTVVRTKGQVTIPAEIRKAARLEEGDPVEVELVEEGILLRPRKVVDATQAWFWSTAWQSMERDVDELVAEGSIIESEGPDEFFADLERSTS
ncbi:MAG: AbrB/MazE/SpoVT family DNA-binding domain-containing protein [Gaiellaceae bacterium]